MKKNILFLDIGNTSITLGFKGVGEKVVGIRKIKSQDLEALIFLLKNVKNIEKVFMVSVSPGVSKKISQIFKSRFNDIRIIKVGKDIEIPIKSRYSNAAVLGVDRLLNAFYVKEMFGFPAVCVDVGTALTIDLISKRGEFLGGIISPGFKLCLEALFKNTALLPYVKIKESKKIYGNTTEQCITLGVVKSISALIDRVTEEYQKKYNNVLYKVITGGDATLIESSIKEKFRHVPYLSLSALSLICLKMGE
ncbi:MAG: type III pantothenate kinase [Candidatus Saelkia tenebricola]|nr:type III pantothenate kinase [Candidatus Saelkia tenebricola]